MNRSFIMGYSLGIFAGAIVYTHGNWWDVVFTSTLVFSLFIALPWLIRR